MQLLENQVRWQYRLLSHAGHYTQLHAQDVNNDKIVSRELVKGEEEVVKWAKEFNAKANLFLGRNPRTQDGKVAGITCISFDIDPIRRSQTASLPEQYQRAIKIGEEVQRWFQCRGELSSILCTSGNGILLILPYDSDGSTIEEIEQRTKALEELLRQQISDKEVRLDATYDAARLVKLMGSVSTKGERKYWRHARFLHSPVFRAKRSRILETVRGIETSQSRHLPLLDNPKYPSRSEADIALAARCAIAGLGPEATLGVMREYSFRPDRTDDHKRIVSKVFTYDAGMVQGTGVGRSLGGSSDTEELKLWTPNDPIQSNNEKANHADYLSTGFKWLNERLGGGYRPSVCYAVEAPTNIGKTQFIVQSANTLCESGKKVLLIATEASIPEIVERYIAIGTGIPAACLASGNLTEDQRKQLADYQGRFRSHSLFIHYTVSPRTEQIEKFIEEVKPDILLWDYFQHFETIDMARQTQLGTLARWYESAAIKYQIPVVVAAQLHLVRDFKTGKKRQAMMNDIKDCKVLNDVSKTVIVLDWDSADQSSEDGPVNVSLVLEKNKGKMGSTNLVLRRNIPRFEEI